MNTDFLFDDDGDIPLFAKLVTGDEVTVQRVRRRLKTFKGEWIEDGSVGLDFVGFAAQKPPDVNSQGALVLVELTTTPGVAQVENFTNAFQIEQRRVLFSGRLVLESGTVVPFEFSPALAANSLPYVAILFGSGQVIS